MRLEQLELPIKIDVAAIAAAGAAIGAFVGLATAAVNATFKWADELDSISDIMGVTSKQAAALNFVLRKSGVATTSLTKGMTILEKGLVKADGSLDTIGKSLNDFGINIFDVNGQVKDQAALLDEIGRKYNSFSTQQERVNFLTEVFGRSGAELVDFFDTLAQEGGIDKVTEKVKAFGLAIDPDRYEQFNRNLEELKLIGLGLAVVFTEKVMPIFEALLAWVTKFLQADTPTKLRMLEAAIKAADETIAAYVDGLTKKIEETDWNAVIQKMVDWINGIGTGPQFDSAALNAIGRLIKAIIKVITEYDWSPVGQALSNKFDEQMEKMGLNPETVKTVLELGGIVVILAQIAKWGGIAVSAILGFGATLATIGSLINALATVNWLVGAPFLIKLGRLFPQISLLTTLFQGLIEVLGTVVTVGGVTIGTIGGIILALGLWIAVIGYVIVHWEELKTYAGYVIWYIGWQLQNFANYMQTKFTSDVKNAARSAADWLKNAFDSAISWVGQRVQNFVNWLSQVLNNLPGVNIPVNTPHTPGGIANPHRASGGPVIAGQPYNVAEFYKPEVFTPSTNGRIDQKDESKTIFDLDYYKLASILSVELAKVTN